jgi:single-stranded-DNA-specific exonuclease
MMRVLERLGAKVSFFIPNRFNDGYGLHLECIQELAETRRPSLMISVDCGVRSLSEVDASRELGIDWIITDHHAIGAKLPAAVAIVHPLLGDQQPNRHLAGVGVAFKLAQALLGDAPVPTGTDRAFLEDLLKLVAIGTVADMVPLAGENALLVKMGLRALAGKNDPGLAALLRAARVEGPVRAQHIAFGVGPRLNAVGRMDGADDAVHLLMSKSASEAGELAERVEALNTERKETQKALLERLAPPCGDPFDLVVEPSAHKGVVGIAAGQRMRESGLPTAVCAVADGIVHGSLRAPEGYDLTEILEAVRPWLRSGGGHRLAGGMSFPLAHLESVREVFNRVAARQAEGAPSALRMVDGLGLEFAPTLEDIMALEPFGQTFPEPVFAVSGQIAQPPRAFGSGGHRKVRIAGVADLLTWFFADEAVPNLSCGDRLCVAVSPQDNPTWGRSWIVDSPLEAQASKPA